MKIKTKRGARRIRNQRVISKRFVVTDYTGTNVVAAGKLYHIKERPCDITAKIVSEIGFNITIITPNKRFGCSHIDEREWRWAVI